MPHVIRRLGGVEGVVDLSVVDLTYQTEIYRAADLRSLRDILLKRGNAYLDAAELVRDAYEREEADRRER
jgi:Glu-tRNA(Gln) amidotransferase subunit E-like FAD-binding protein